MATERAGAPPTASQQEAAEKIFAFVLNQMRAGSDKQAIASRLQELGVDPADSRQVVETVYTDVMKTAARQQPTSSSVVTAAIGGAAAAIAAGFVWALIVRLTNYEVGFMALGLGLLAGAAVVVSSGGRRGLALQIVAVGSSLVGILAAKYFIFVHVLHRAVLKEYGPEQAAAVVVFSARILGFFFESIVAVLSGYDAIWVLLAVVTAWRLPRGLGIRLPRHERGMIV